MQCQAITCLEAGNVDIRVTVAVAARMDPDTGFVRNVCEACRRQLDARDCTPTTDAMRARAQVVS